MARPGRPTGSSSPSAPGDDYTCGVRADGSAACWGYDEVGEATPPDGEFASVSAGHHHTCGVRADGSAACWGYDEFGQARLSCPTGSSPPSAPGIAVCLRGEG